MEALKKIKRKTFYLCLRKLPHNLHYKPHNYFPHINHYINEKGINGAFYKIIYPSYISMLAIEPELYLKSLRIPNRRCKSGNQKAAF